MKTLIILGLIAWGVVTCVDNNKEFYSKTPEEQATESMSLSMAKRCGLTDLACNDRYIGSDTYKRDYQQWLSYWHAAAARKHNF